MKKLGLLMMPLMAISLLASCNNSTDVCIVTFNSNGGSFVETQKVKKGGTAHEPKMPIRDKYDFTGWCLDGSTFEFSMKITQDIILVANWDKIPEPGVTHTIGFSGSDCKAGKTTDDLKDVFQISCEEGEINLIVAPNDSFALTNVLNFLVDGVRVAPKSYIQDGSNYKLTFQLSGETLIYIDALPVSASHKVTFSGDEHCSMFYGTQPVTSDQGIEIPVPDINPYYVKFSVEADGSTYMKPGTLSLNGGTYTDYFFDKETGDLLINLQENIAVTGECDVYKSLKECSWSQIEEISNSGKAYKAFKIGDTKTVKVNELNHTVRIIGFNHDELSTSTEMSPKYAGITFEFANVITDSSGAVTTIWDSSNNFDYRESSINTFLNDKTEGAVSVINMLPSDPINKDLKEVIKPVSKKVGVNETKQEGEENYSALSFAKNKYPKLFLLAYYEITQIPSSSITNGEGLTYQYYKYHDDDDSRIKRAVNDNSNQLYWIRSPFITVTNWAWLIRDTGSVGTHPIASTYAVAPAFCV